MLKELAGDFRALVNMTADELRDWLDTDESEAVGWKGPDGDLAESVGHASGRRILSILGKPPGDHTADDEAHMRKVVGFIRRHRAQEPANPVTSRWRLFADELGPRSDQRLRAVLLMSALGRKRTLPRFCPYVGQTKNRAAPRATAPFPKVVQLVSLNAIAGKQGGGGGIWA